MCEEITGKKLSWTYQDLNRTGDHIWWVSDVSKFQKHYPNWTYKYDLKALLNEMYELNRERWVEADVAVK